MGPLTCLVRIAHPGYGCGAPPPPKGQSSPARDNTEGISPGCPFSKRRSFESLTGRDLSCLFRKEHSRNSIFGTFRLSLPPRRPQWLSETVRTGPGLIHQCWNCLSCGRFLGRGGCLGPRCGGSKCRRCLRRGRSSGGKQIGQKRGKRRRLIWKIGCTSDRFGF